MTAGHYQKNNKRLRKEARERYQNILEEEKKRQYSHERYQNISDEEK